ncbi:MAG: threonine/serine exporter family protein [Oscillospiraceae bacterium]|nr:threonine/serine exporter family protein [Oscillospiraceae bacterium]
MADRALKLIMDCGQAMLKSGGEAFRAQDTMEIMARSLGLEDFHVYVLTNGIFASAKGGTVNAVRYVPTFSTNLGRVEAINSISRKIADGDLDLDGAEQELKKAMHTPVFSEMIEHLASMVGCACFAFLFGGGPAEMLAAALAGVLESVIVTTFSHHRINRMFTDLLAATACTLLAHAAHLFYAPLNVNVSIIGALMVLTPGVALTMAIRDIINGDYLSGTIRLFDALLVAGCLAGGVSLGYLLMQGIMGVIA